MKRLLVGLGVLCALVGVACAEGGGEDASPAVFEPAGGDVNVQANPGAACRADGQRCTKSSQCCSSQCNAGTCAPTIPSGSCNYQGQGCTGSTSCTLECCSRACGATATAGSACQPSSGCMPTGEVCSVDSDCCGWAGAPPPVQGASVCQKAAPTDMFGRCAAGGACMEAGSICKTSTTTCSATSNCCDPVGVPTGFCNANPDACCRADSNGIGRCLVRANSCTAPVPAGTVCATSADCCGQPCVNNQCQAACVPTGSTCTTNADCCSGLSCSVPVGSKNGTCGGSVGCSLYGQSCTTSSSCCGGVACTNGRCLNP